MHELTVCRGLLREVDRIAAATGAARVVSITVRIGPLSGVEPDLLQNAFPFAVAGTSAADSCLIIERAAVRVRCRSCGRESEVSANRLICAHCLNWQVALIGGDELMLMRLELQRDCDS